MKGYNRDCCERRAEKMLGPVDICDHSGRQGWQRIAFWWKTEKKAGTTRVIYEMFPPLRLGAWRSC